MLNLRKINPMVRAVGTMGAVSALVGGITFAQLTSNTVALSPNTLSTGTANLEIGGERNYGNYNGNNNDNNNNDNLSTDTTTGNNTDNNTNNTSGPNNQSANLSDNNNYTRNNSCRNTTNGSIPGFNLTGQNGLLPNVTSDPLKFCLKNTSNVPLDLTVAIPDDPFASTSGLDPTDVTLTITCTNGGNAMDTLDQFVGATDETLGSLAANGTTNCQATVELTTEPTGTGAQTLPAFDIDFTGTSAS